MPKRQLIGNIISAKMPKTVIVEVERTKEDPKYKRRYRVHKKYKAHTENGEYKAGDTVVIEECRPISKEKKWRVINKIASAKIGQEAAESEEILEGIKSESPKIDSAKEADKSN